MSGFREIMIDEWWKEFKPLYAKHDLSQLLADNISMSDYVFEPDDSEKFQRFRVLASFCPDHVWTWCAQGNEEWISNGYHLVNRMAYLFTEKPKEPNVEYQIDFEEF